MKQCEIVHAALQSVSNVLPYCLDETKTTFNKSITTVTKAIKWTSGMTAKLFHVERVKRN